MKELIKKLETIGIDVYLEDIKDISNIDELYDHLLENGHLDVEIIYYSNAIDYLMKNDNSLRASLEIANDLGYEVDKLDSEVLASLLASQNLKEDFDGIREELEALLKGNK